MTARQDTEDLARSMNARGITIGFSDANTLRRAEKTLHNWAEKACGDSSDYASFGIERDEDDDSPWWVYRPHRTNETHRHRIADREAGALKRVQAVCERINGYFYHQTDPRGVALYVSAEPMSDSNYASVGVSCSR